MLNLNYNLCAWKSVPNLTEFYKLDLNDTKKVHAMIDNIKILFSLTTNRLTLECAEEKPYYRIGILTNGATKQLIAWFVYLPDLGRVDLYNAENPECPMMQWKNKKPVFSRLPTVINEAGVDKLFSRVINVS